MTSRKSTLPIWSIALAIALPACSGTTVPGQTGNSAKDDVAAPQPTQETESEPKQIVRDSGATVYVQERGNLSLHSYVAPVEAFANASQVIELKQSLVVVDPQLTVGFAKDLRAYVDGLGKPIARLIVSHAHPDHYFGLAAAFEDVDSYALADTRGEIEETGEQVRQAREKMFPAGWVPDHITAPTNTLEPGEVVVDGETFVFMKHTHAEHPAQLSIRLPAAKITIAQDLVYTGVHPVVTDREALDSWKTILERLRSAGPSDLVLPGHGAPTNVAGIEFMSDYLSKCQELLAAGKDQQTFKAAILSAYPDLGGENFVDFSLMFLFPQQAGAPE